MDEVKVRKSKGNKAKAKKKKKWYGKKEIASKKRATQKDLESFAEQFNRKHHRG